MLEFTRDGASGGPKAIVWTENEKNIAYSNLHVDKNWWIFSLVFQIFASVRSSPAHFCGELLWGMKSINSTHNSIVRCLLGPLIKK